MNYLNYILIALFAVMAGALLVSYCKGEKPERRLFANQRGNAPIMVFGSDRLAPDPGLDQVAPGQMVLANESRFVEGHFDEPMTEYVQGNAEREDLEEALEELAPSVDSPRRFTFKTSADDQFLSENDDIRGIGGDFKRIDTAGGEEDARTYNKGLTIRLDKDEIATGGSERAIQHRTMMLTDRLFRNDIDRTITAYSAGATNTAKTWNATANPDKDMLDTIETSGDASGVNPNVVIMGPTSRILRYGSYSDGARTIALPNTGFTNEQLADFLGVDRVVELKARRQAKKGGTKTKMIGNEIFFARAERFTDGSYDGTNVKRFVSPVQGGGRLAVYVRERDKYYEITVEHYSHIVAVTTKGLRKLTVSAS